MADPVNPNHYRRDDIELADVIDAWNLPRWRAQAVQYLFRADYKGSQRDDLLKAKWYIERELALLETSDAPSTFDKPATGWVCGTCNDPGCGTEQPKRDNPECTSQFKGRIWHPGDCSTYVSEWGTPWQNVSCHSCRAFYNLPPIE